MGVIFIVVLAGMFLAFVLHPREQMSMAPQSTVTCQPRKPPKTLDALLRMPASEIDKLDIALIDLLCAKGLRGSEDLNIQECLNTLDEWARRVQQETERNLHRFKEDPGEYNNSFAYYRMGMLAMVLQQDFGVQYDPVLKKIMEEDDKLAESRPARDRRKAAERITRIFHENPHLNFIHRGGPRKPGQWLSYENGGMGRIRPNPNPHESTTTAA
jgi:hypothetical protein